MSDKEILMKAIRKANENGWGPKAEKIIAQYNTDDEGEVLVWIAPRFIFNHDFAKALWGETGKTLEGLQTGGIEGTLPYWAYHLQQMVISPDPIKYLSENIQ